MAYHLAVTVEYLYTSVKTTVKTVTQTETRGLIHVVPEKACKQTQT